MALDEATRHALHQRLDEVLGPEHTAALMTAYPPVAWAEVATKQDLRELELRLESMLQREISAAITSQTRAVVFAVVGAMFANASLTIGALALTR